MIEIKRISLFLLSLILGALIAFLMSGCTTYNGYPALIPLPYGPGPGVVITNGVNITPVTVNSAGSSTSFTVITPRGK
jgi:hypothetical protein